MVSIIQIDDKLISANLWLKHFACDISECAGICCVLGDSGAPLEDFEAQILEKEYPNFKTYMKPEGIKAVEEQGLSVYDSDNDLGTTLIAGKECAYSCFDSENVCYCAIERAFQEGKTTFRKPISCWLYPIRLKQLSENIALNYDQQSMCSCACARGEEQQIPVFRFLSESIIHRFGKEFYDEMEKVYELDEFKQNKK